MISPSNNSNLIKFLEVGGCYTQSIHLYITSQFRKTVEPNIKQCENSKKKKNGKYVSRNNSDT